MNREVRIYRFLCQNPGWQPRDKIMHWTGHRSPKAYPVIAYVEFQNEVMRLNARLARGEKRVIRQEGTELYTLDYAAAKSAA